VHAIRVIRRDDPVSAADRAAKSAAGVLPIAAFLAGAVLILAGSGSAGPVAVAFGSVLAVIASILMAWVVLVEVLR